MNNRVYPSESHKLSILLNNLRTLFDDGYKSPGNSNIVAQTPGNQPVIVTIKREPQEVREKISESNLFDFNGDEMDSVEHFDSIKETEDSMIIHVDI